MSGTNRSMESLLLSGEDDDDDNADDNDESSLSSSSGGESDGGSRGSGSSTRAVAGRINRGPPPPPPPLPRPRGSADETRKEKARARIFIRILLKYLERKDPGLHARVSAVIVRCKTKNRARVPGYESVTASMKAKLRKIVSDSYWTRAEAYTQSFLATRNERDNGNGGGRSSSGGSSSPLTCSQGQQTHEH